MPNHTTFSKHSKKKEIRVQSCHGFISAFRERVTFLLPLSSPWHPHAQQPWLFDCFPLDSLSKRFRCSFLFMWGS